MIHSHQPIMQCSILYEIEKPSIELNTALASDSIQILPLTLHIRPDANTREVNLQRIIDFKVRKLRDLSAQIEIMGNPLRDVADHI